MTEDTGVQATVETLTRVFGDRAAGEAERMADKMSGRKDPSGREFWLQVHRALRKEPKEDGPTQTIEPPLPP